MKKHIDRFSNWILQLTASEKFFVAVIILFVIQALWLVFSAVHPLPFDEHTHVGNLRIYAQQWTPFISDQPPSASVLGDITREPSFLYYYLMSFPWRFFDLLTDNQAAIIIATRIINVAFVAGGLVLFRKLLRTWGVSSRITSVAILAFVVTPIVPFIAAHVNYDNLMFLLTPVFLLVATRLITDNKDFVRRMMLFIFLAVTAVLVKRTFLPLAGVTGLYVLFVIWRREGAKTFSLIRDSWRKVHKGATFFLLCMGLILSLGLFAERYGGNVINYGSIWPECHQIQPREVCAEWGPWRRDNIGIIDSRPAQREHNVFGFSGMWVVWMMRGYFALFSHMAGAPPQPGDPYGGIGGKGQLPLPIVVADVAVTLGVLAIIWQRKKIWQSPYMRFALIICIGFIVAQWFFNLQTYLKLWRAVAIQARYTYPILIVLFAVMMQAASWGISSRFKKFTAQRVKAGLFTLFVLTYVWGGGIAGWVVRSPDNWHWQNHTVQTVNHAARDVLKYLIIH